MRIALTIVIAVGMLCSFSAAQDSTPSPNATTPRAQLAQGQPGQSQSAGLPKIAPGSVIPVQLTKTVDAKKVKTGDEVDVKVTQDMKNQSGQVLMPKDTKIIGHVTEVQPSTKEQKASQLGIAFDHAVLKEGNDVSMPASIQAVIAPPNQNPGNANSGGGGTAGSSGNSPGNSSSGGRSGMPGGSSQSSGSYPTGPAGNNQADNISGGNSANPQITASTQGVIGISNYKLSTPGDVTQGSVVSSEKGNVKLESGTLMLLRVNQ